MTLSYYYVSASRTGRVGPASRHHPQLIGYYAGLPLYCYQGLPYIHPWGWLADYRHMMR